MAKRVVRAKKSIESLKKEIELHFAKLENDLSKGNIDRGRYHTKEIQRSLISALKIKMKILGKTDDNLLDSYNKKLKNLFEKYSLE